MSTPLRPFHEIALCLSGGGYRAAGFHLGSMSYINRIKVKDGSLIERVKAISTVSGGTIIGAYYVLCDAQGKSFDKFYDEFRGFLENHDLIKESLEKVGGDDEWEYDHKNHNLINAFSEIYDELLTKGERMSTISNSDNGHIELCSFNTTEFSYGINFRFQLEKVDGVPYKKIKRGNRYVDVSYDAQDEVRISDVIAASSCFPGGFEPMRFPHDFCGKDTEQLEKLKEKDPFSDGIGLMDGGIYDNQGIDSIRISERRRANRHSDETGNINIDRLPYDMIIISDVSSPDINKPFKFHNAQDHKISDYSFSTLANWVKSWGHLGTWLSFILFATGIIMGFINNWQNNFVSGIAMMISVLGIALLIIRWYAGKKITFWSNELSGFISGSIDDFYLKKLSTLDFKNYKVKHLEPLLMDRFNSVSLMVQDLFLKQVRRLKYGAIYEDKLYENRRIANLIKELTEDDWSKTSEYQKMPIVDSLLMGDYQKVMGDHIPQLVKDASSFGTTLWFTEDDQLKEIQDKLIITGQLTMCFNLMVYIEEIRNAAVWKDLNEDHQKEIDSIFEQCKSDWMNLKENPHFLLDIQSEYNS